MKLSNSLYDKLKWVAQILLPAIITLYGTIAMAVGLPYTDVVVTILGAVDAFLGTILGISTANYNTELERQRFEEFEEKKRLTNEAIAKVQNEMDERSGS